jgi:sec-independent protein translocase protein TatA
MGDANGTHTPPQIDLGRSNAYIGHMFGSIGPAELILIFIVALLVFGPKRLPEIGKSVGKAIREFKRTSEEIKGRIEDEIQASEIKDAARDLKNEITGITSGVTGLKDDLLKDTEIKEPPKDDAEEGKKVS